MTSAVVVALIGLLSTMGAAVFAYWSTKQREREAGWRSEKLEYYKLFVESLSGIVEGDATPDGHKLFARASNNLLLFAPQYVIDALNAFRGEISVSNPNRSRERHDKLLAGLVLAIRGDVGVFPLDNPASFKLVLWSSGASSDAAESNSASADRN